MFAVSSSVKIRRRSPDRLERRARRHERRTAGSRGGRLRVCTRLSDGSGGTLNVLAFESEETARAALAAAKAAPRPPFMQLESVDLLRVLATA